MTSEKRLIDANALWLVFGEEAEKIEIGVKDHRKLVASKLVIHWCMEQLAKAPKVDAMEVVHAKWIYQDDTEMIWTTKAICSACKRKVAHNSTLALDYGIENFEKIHKYCPNCGAKMDGGNEDG